MRNGEGFEYVCVIKQEVRVIDGSLFITHWHEEEKYWSYDQLSKNLIDNCCFNDLKKGLLSEILNDVHDIVEAINRLSDDGLDYVTVNDFFIRRIG